jgi:hypothetical protein
VAFSALASAKVLFLWAIAQPPGMFLNDICTLHSELAVGIKSEEAAGTRASEVTSEYIVLGRPPR